MFSVRRFFQYRCKTSSIALGLGLISSFSLPAAAMDATLRSQVLQREAQGDLTGARTLIQQAPDSDRNEALAEFLDRHNDPGAREAYQKWIAGTEDADARRTALRQLVLNDFIHDRTSDFAADLSQYRASGGTDLVEPAKLEKPVAYSKISIPGPLSSFARMAALSPDLAPEELLPALARNVVTNGYEASGNEALQQTEYLRLVGRYLGEARELQALAGSDRKISIPNCDSEQTGNLLKVLGYRMRGSCGGDIVLETVNPTRAFLTVDSGFPLAELEADLRANHKFELSYSPTEVPVLYDAKYWMAAVGRNAQGDFIDAFLSDPSLCRLYLGLSHVDRQTAEALRKQASPARLKVFSHVLDFYGAMFQIRNGAAVVPGSPKAWQSIVGVSPSSPGAFFEKLLALDDGWAASYFDALSRVTGPAETYLTQPDRLRRFYDALRGKITTPGPARPVFRSSTELMLLTTSLRIDPNGQPHVPGNIDIWRNLFIKHPHGKYDGKLTRSAQSWRSNDDLLEALFGMSRKTVENEPLRIFLTLTDMDRGRTKAISPELAGRLVNAYRSYGAQYSIFADVPTLSEQSIGRFLDAASQISAIRDPLLRADTLGMFQGEVELWRILAVRDEIPRGSQDSSFLKLATPFGKLHDEAELFDTGRAGIQTLLAAADTSAIQSTSRQEQIIELLVGKLQTGTPSQNFTPADSFLHVFDAQRLISIDSLFSLADKKGKLDGKAAKNFNDQMERLADSEASRSMMSTEEKNSYSVGYWSNRHLEQERKFSLDRQNRPSEKKDIREGLAPFLRDSIVGLLYSYYAPAGSQLLMTNPQLVRGHDFIGPESAPAAWRTTEVSGSGWPASAGGRLTGSLVALPYAVAEAEQNFLSPKREQALIWADLVPQMIASVTITRWRDVKPEQIRYVALRIQRGQNLLAAAALNLDVEKRVLESYARYATPAKVEWLADHLHASRFSDTVAEVPPAILYAFADDPALKNISPDVASRQLEVLTSEHPKVLSTEVIGRTFGTPKPNLTHSYQPGLLSLRTFPALMGFSSRILAESWESNNLSYAALADEIGAPVSQLDAYVPEWNRAAIENIFATHLEDWPALLRSLQLTAKNVRQQNGQTAVHMAGN